MRLIWRNTHGLVANAAGDLEVGVVLSELWCSAELFRSYYQVCRVPGGWVVSRPKNFGGEVFPTLAECQLFAETMYHLERPA